MGRSTIRSFTLPLLTFFALTVGVVMPAQAQDKNAYKKQFNKGLKTAKAGQKAVKSGNAAQGLDKFDSSISTLQKAAQMASEAGDDKIAGKSKYVASQLAYAAGRVAINQKDNERALQYFTTGIDLYPKYAKNFRGKGLALKKMKKGDQAMAAYGKAIKVGEKNGDYKTSNQAKQGIRQYYVYKASQLLSSENPSTSDANKALSALNKISEYVDPGSKAYYYMAVAHNTKGNYNQAATFADKALQASNGSRSQQARLYFEKAKALRDSGNQNAACSAFDSATFGDVKSRAKYNLKQLECPGASSSE